MLTVLALFATASADTTPLPPSRYMHGFRVGYSFINGGEEHERLSSPHLFVMGYEATQRISGGEWLNVITVQNFMVGGMNQSVFIPTANFLLGFEVNEQFQVGVGPNISPFSESSEIIHMIGAVGYTPKVGDFNVPVHASYIPDVGGNYRISVTTGVNW
ncbi:MAG: hypothetical protein ACI8RZ_005646 [Myxococcota bacterium]|jgi:hypothetical protein